MLQLGGLLKKLQLRTFLFKRDREERNLRSCQLRSINHVEASLSNEDVFPIGEKQSLISGSVFVPGRCGHNHDQQLARLYSFPRDSSLVLTIRTTLIIIGEGKLIVVTKIRLIQAEKLEKATKLDLR